MQLIDKNILVTGGAGFMGSELVGRLVEQNRVIVYDSFARNSIKDKSFYNHPNLSLVKGDIMDHTTLSSAMKDAQIIVHLAAVVGAQTVSKSPMTTMRVNLLGTSNVFDTAMKLETCERVVFLSTSEVFSSSAYHVSEGADAVLGSMGDTRLGYAVSKLVGEHYAFAAFKEFGLPMTILRPFNVYGPGQFGENALQTFIRLTLNNDNIQISGDGDEIRSWIYIDDMVDVILLAMSRDEAIGESFNIGNPRGTITIRTLAEMIVKLVDCDTQITHTVNSVVGAKSRSPDIDKARHLLGFEPRVELEDGIRRTIEWHRTLKEVANDDT